MGQLPLPSTEKKQVEFIIGVLIFTWIRFLVRKFSRKKTFSKNKFFSKNYFLDKSFSWTKFFREKCFSKLRKRKTAKMIFRIFCENEKRRKTKFWNPAKTKNCENGKKRFRATPAYIENQKWFWKWLETLSESSNWNVRRISMPNGQLGTTRFQQGNVSFSYTLRIS